jgi:catechol 2,3-dioxygenase-like lactoylglutathione lyase family enzyme
VAFGCATLYNGRMRVHGLAWLGTRTDAYRETVRFFRDVLGLDLRSDEDDFAVLTLPDGGKVEVFGPATSWNRHFVTGPVAGFLVDDVHAAVDELRDAGVEIVQEPGDNYWAHFRGPDGHIYEVTADPELRSSRPT